MVDPGEILPPIVSTEITFGTNLYIKFPWLLCASGSTGPIVLLLQWSTMPEEEFAFLPCAGITNTASDTATGYIMITRTRCGNYAAWRHLFSACILPYIKLQKEVLDLGETNLTMDGEAGILSAVMELPPADHPNREALTAQYGGKTVIDEANEQELTMTKEGASRTIREQAADKCKEGFKGLKVELRRIARDDIDTSHPALEKRILKLLDSIVLQERCETAVLPLADKTKYAKGICTVVYAMKNGGRLNPKDVARSFVLIGQHAKRVGEMGYEAPEIKVLGIENPSVDIGILLTNNMVDNTDAEIAQMVISFPEALKMWEKNGTLTRNEMDYLKIPRLPDDDDSPPRDGLQLWRQGAVLLTCAATLARLAAFREARRPPTEEEKAEKEAQALVLKGLLEAQDLIDKEAEKQAKKKKKTDAAAVEKARKEALSKDELAAEKLENKQQKLARKIAKEEEQKRQQDEAADKIASADPQELADANARRGAGRGRGGRGRGRGGGGRGHGGLG